MRVRVRVGLRGEHEHAALLLAPLVDREHGPREEQLLVALEQPLQVLLAAAHGVALASRRHAHHLGAAQRRAQLRHAPRLAHRRRRRARLRKVPISPGTQPGRIDTWRTAWDGSLAPARARHGDLAEAREREGVDLSDLARGRERDRVRGPRRL